jgi:hypothetical protein
MESKGIPGDEGITLTPEDRSQAISALVEEQQSWLEKKLKPKTINARYPFTGKPLLWATCGFGSLGDALFGLNSGIVNRKQIKDYMLTLYCRHYVRSTGEFGLYIPLFQRLWGCQW